MSAFLCRKVISSAIFAMAALAALADAASASGKPLESKWVMLHQPPESIQGRVAWRDWIEREQAPVLKELARLTKNGEIERHKPFWILNRIRAVGTESAFDALKAVSGVTGIENDEPFAFRDDPPPPQPRGRAAAAASDEEHFQVWDTFVYKVWEDYGLKGQSMRIGMSDTGIDPNHPEFTSKIAGFRVFNELGEPVDSETQDTGSHHGTSVAGLMIGGDADGDGKTIGMAPEAEILVTPDPVSSADPEKSFPSFDGLLASYQWLVDPDGNPATDDGARVINGSFGTLPSSAAVPLSKAIAQMGTLMVNSIGNSGPDVETTVTPGNVPEYVLGVGAGAQISVQGILSVTSFSSRGPIRWNVDEFKGLFVKPDITAPGTGVWSTEYGGAYDWFSGTSASSPVAAGICLLVFQADPSLTPLEVAQIVKDTANVFDSGGRYVEIPNNDYGYGFINAKRAVATVREPGTVRVSIGLGTAARARIRIQGTGFVRDYRAGETLSFNYAPGSYKLEAVADDLKTAVIPFTVTAGQTVNATGSTASKAADDGVFSVGSSAALVPWFLPADGKSTAVANVRLGKRIYFQDGAEKKYRTVPAAGTSVALRVRSGGATVPDPVVVVDENGEAKIEAVAGAATGEAKLDLVWIDANDGAETTIESYTLKLVPKRAAPPTIDDVSIDPSPPVGGYPSKVYAEIASPSGADFTAEVVYSTDDFETEETVPMSDLDGRWSADLPAFAGGAALRYYIRVLDEFDGVASEAKGAIADFSNPSALRQELTALGYDESGEPLHTQLPLDIRWGKEQLLADPIPERRDVYGPQRFGYDDESVYFGMKLKSYFEASDNPDSIFNTNNAFLYMAPFWREPEMTWSLAAAYLPGAIVFGAPQLAIINSKLAYETDQEIEVDLGDGNEFIFGVKKNRLQDDLTEDGLVLSFQSAAINVERFFLVEMDVTPTYRLYPRSHSETVQAGAPRPMPLNPGWNLVNAPSGNSGSGENTGENGDVWGLEGRSTGRTSSLSHKPQSRPIGTAVWLFSTGGQNQMALLKDPSEGVVRIRLEAGWNLLANPFTTDLILARDAFFEFEAENSQKPHSLPEAVEIDPPPVSSNIFRYRDGYQRLDIEDPIASGEGFAVKALSPGWIVLKINDAGG